MDTKGVITIGQCNCVDTALCGQNPTIQLCGHFTVWTLHCADTIGQYNCVDTVLYGHYLQYNCMNTSLWTLWNYTTLCRHYRAIHICYSCVETLLCGHNHIILWCGHNTTIHLHEKNILYKCVDTTLCVHYTVSTLHSLDTKLLVHFHTIPLCGHYTTVRTLQLYTTVCGQSLSKEKVTTFLCSTLTWWWHQEDQAARLLRSRFRTSHRGQSYSKLLKTMKTIYIVSFYII